MLISKIQAKYGITSNVMNRMCWDFGVVPVYRHSYYYINKNAVIYYLENTSSGLTFKEMSPFRFTSQGIPIYALINDNTGKKDMIRADLAYLYTWYGPMPKETIMYPYDYQYSKDEVYTYRYNQYEITPDAELQDIIYINKMIFRKFTTEIYVSPDGVIFDTHKSVFRRYSFNRKLYVQANCYGKVYQLNRLVYRVWEYNNEPLPEDLQVDHIDGFKNHNNIENLRMVTNLENSRSAAYDQNLRTTRWNEAIIRRMCELMCLDTISGPREICDTLNKEFPKLDASYKQIKRKIYEILNKKFWVDISGEYEVEKYRENFSNHNQAPTEDAVIHQICRAHLTRDPIETNKEFAERNGFSISVVNRVLRGEYRTDISSQYNFPYSEKKRIAFGDEEVHSICKDVMAGHSSQELEKKYGRPYRLINDIIQRRSRPDISSQYNFESIYPNRVYKIPYKYANM